MNIMNVMEFSEWITKKYIEWRGEAFGQERSITKFAEMLGVKRSLLTQWMQKDGKVPSSHLSINALVAYYGPEVYDVLGLERPPQTPFDQLPESVRSRLVEATLRVQEELIRRGPDLTQSEADQIARDIFAGMGVTFTDTATQKDLPPSDIKP